ncbi:hypothetical protein H4R34_004670 [Dimargaris verticillata]|uniref:Uncharacterized protein n=1 Tax=Dimargaris verticillata TaxID=2761393 RepID=A0A9W8B072_9FUNG|nr:hypothetical protein H4R34_004670 [Dimargaris verticillata]
MPANRSQWCQESARLYTSDQSQWTAVLAEHPERVEVWRFFADTAPAGPCASAVHTLPRLPSQTLQDWAEGVADEKQASSTLALLKSFQCPGFVPSDQTLVFLLSVLWDPHASASSVAEVVGYLSQLLAMMPGSEVFSKPFEIVFEPLAMGGFWSTLHTIIEQTNHCEKVQPSSTIEFLVSVLERDLRARAEGKLEDSLLLNTFHRSYKSFVVTHVQPALATLFAAFERSDLDDASNYHLHELLHMRIFIFLATVSSSIWPLHLAGSNRSTSLMAYDVRWLTLQLVILGFINRVDLNSLVTQTYQWLRRVTEGPAHRFIQSLCSPNFKVLVLDTFVRNECVAGDKEGSDLRAVISLDSILDHHCTTVGSMATRRSTRYHPISPDRIVLLIKFVCDLAESYVDSRCELDMTSQSLHTGLSPTEINALGGAREHLTKLGTVLDANDAETLLYLQRLQFVMMDLYMNLCKPTPSRTQT